MIVTRKVINGKTGIVSTEDGGPLVLVVKTRLINLEVMGLNLRVGTLCILMPNVRSIPNLPLPELHKCGLNWP